jgi:hypothetical protein
MVDDQQEIFPTHLVNGKGISAAHGVPPNGHVTNSEG